MTHCQLHAGYSQQKSEEFSGRAIFKVQCSISSNSRGRWFSLWCLSLLKLLPAHGQNLMIQSHYANTEGVWWFITMALILKFQWEAYCCELDRGINLLLSIGNSCCPCLIPASQWCLQTRSVLHRHSVVMGAWKTGKGGLHPEACSGRRERWAMYNF